MEVFDLVVVGGGFAGLSCAQTAAQRGLKTLVLEKNATAGLNPQSTGIVVKEVADIWNIPRQLTRKIGGVRLYAPSLEYVDLESPGYYFLATDTPALLRWMATQTETAGAQMRYQSQFQHARYIDELYEINQYNLKSRYLVGCDGTQSKVAHNLHLGVNEQFLFGVEAVYEGVGNVDDNYMHVFLDSDLAPGYMAWLVPGLGVTQVGLAVRSPAVPKLDNLITKLSQLFDFKYAQILQNRTGLIPCGGSVKPFAGNNSMLLGDAAGMVSPLTAGGIHPAVEISRIAGIAISDYLLDGGPNPQTIVQKVIPNYRYKKAMRNALDLVNIDNQYYDRFIHNHVFKNLAKTLFFHHRGLFTWNAWKDIVNSVKAVKC